jgi:hypothetical protein
MNGAKDVSVNLIQEAIKTSNAIGCQKTIDILRRLRSSDSSSVFTESIELVVNEVLLHFKMTKTQLLDKKGESRLARRFCYVLLQHFMGTDIRYLTSYFNRSDKSVYLEVKLFHELERHNKVDVLVLERYDVIFKKIEKKLKK